MINTGRAASSDWSEQSFPIEKSLYDAVYTVDGPYAVGSGGYVYERTSDGWVEMETPVTADLYGVAYPTADFLSSIPEAVDVAVGSSGKVVERA